MLIAGYGGLDLASAFNPRVTAPTNAAEVLNLDHIDASNATLITATGWSGRFEPNRKLPCTRNQRTPADELRCRHLKRQYRLG